MLCYFLSLGHIQSRAVYFLMNIHVLPKTIYLTRVRIWNYISVQVLFSFSFHIVLMENLV